MYTKARIGLAAVTLVYSLLSAASSVAAAELEDIDAGLTLRF